MKIIFIALSIIFFSACSNVEVSGYTESIVKNAKNSVSSSSSEKESKSEETKISALEEDLSSLDEESLREKLLNYYPWPKPKADPSYSETDSIVPENEEEFTFDFQWELVDFSIKEAYNYDFGFDRDPTNLDPNVFISALKEPNIKAKFLPEFNKYAYKDWKIIHESDLEKIKEEKSLENLEEKTLNKAGTYFLYGLNRKNKIS